MPRYVPGGYWRRLLFDPGDPIEHEHICPTCFKKFRCHDTRCDFFPEQELPDGTPVGAYIYCGADCIPKPDPRPYIQWA